jgi:hypothetical protein
MSIQELRILPPFAIGRFGSSPTPLEAYELKVREDDPLGFRKICPAETLEISPGSGAVKRCYTPERIRFRDGDLIRPVAPFLEVFAKTSADTWKPLTLDLLKGEGLGPKAVRWAVEVANLKVFRQTGDAEDKVTGQTGVFSDHKIHELKGECPHFHKGRYVAFGSVRYICPSKEFPQIRLRFTPAKGLVYGADEKDPLFDGHPERVVYDSSKSVAKWLGFRSTIASRTLCNPSDIYEGAEDNQTPTQMGPSKGYLDDVCDGPVTVQLTLKDGTHLKARAWISACMPAFAPDSQPVRTVADELEQLLFGPDIKPGMGSLEEAAEIVRRALETVRLMNTAVMNGNLVDGRVNIAHTLITQDTNDYRRLYAPIMASSLADNLAVRALHERVYTALLSGSAPWFAQVLRQPEEVADLSDKGRRKMPPMLRGADGRCLALTRRQANKIIQAAKDRACDDGEKQDGNHERKDQSKSVK